MSLSTLHSYKKHGLVAHRTSSVKPLLTPKNEDDHVQFAVDRINTSTGQFKNMYNRIIFDEKWYNLMETTAGFYLVPGEPKPEHHAKSKR